MIDETTKLIIAKPIASGAVAFAIDRYALGQSFTKNNLLFAAAVSSGILVSDLVAKYGKLHGSEIEKSIEGRLMEIGTTVGGTLLVEKFILAQNTVPSLMYQKVGAVIASDVLGEWVAGTFISPLV
jgi:hypothetical protein